MLNVSAYIFSFTLVSCPSLNPPVNGSLSTTSTYPGAVVSVNCDAGYKISAGPANVTCLVNGSWSNKLPSCVPAGKKYYLMFFERTF